ncbi:Protein-lysine N-methyltransferase efm4 [Exophiala xenobiotica]|nr:Protein-lysine N-methyltransferase efm4 [Exophiala xenobiotica]
MSTVKPRPSRPAHHANNNGTRFINPWPSAGAPTWAELLQASFPFGFYKTDLHTHHKARAVKVVKPDWGAATLKDRNLDRRKCIISTWLGHAGALIEIPSLYEADGRSLWLLFDPIFSMRAGPTQYGGVVRAKSSPCQVEDLPGCDAIFISHNHYDHTDWPTIQAVSKRFPKTKYFVLLGIKQWLTSSGIPDKQIYELDWWQNREYSPLDFGLQVTSASDEETILRFSCVPAQHNSGRIVIDQGSTLWCGWVVERLLRSKDDSAESKATRQGAVYHAGDTGYRRITRSETVCPAFKEIGERFGPFDISFVPIWRGGSLGFISNLGLRLSHDDIPSALHGSPRDAVAIHQDVRSRNTVGIHFGTFVGSDNETNEAMIEFGQACDEQGVGDLDDENESDKGRAGTLDIGGSLAVAIK